MEAAGVEPALAGCKYRCAAFTLSPQFEPRKVTLLRLFFSFTIAIMPVFGAASILFFA